MKLLLAAALMGLAAPAMAQDAQTTTSTTTTTTGDMQSQPAATGDAGAMQGGMSGGAGAMAGGEMPTCSASVRDRCVQPARAERVAANEYKGGGKDNSAMMTGSNAGGKSKARRGRTAKRATS